MKSTRARIMLAVATSVVLVAGTFVMRSLGQGESPPSNLERAQPSAGGAVAGISLGEAESGAVYDVLFRPSGYGPGGESAGSVIAFVESSSPRSQYEPAYDPAGKSMVIALDMEARSVVSDEGLYSGVATLESDGTLLRVVVSDVEREK